MIRINGWIYVYRYIIKWRVCINRIRRRKKNIRRSWRCTLRQLLHVKETLLFQSKFIDQLLTIYLDSLIIFFFRPKKTSPLTTILPICCLLFVAFLTAAMIVLALIPLYLPRKDVTLCKLNDSNLFVLIIILSLV